MNPQMEKDQREKLQLVIQQLVPHCTLESEHEVLRKIGKALQNGDNLTGKALTGGFTNYSYNIYLKNEPATAVFAKVAFDRALWNPDQSQHYSLERLRTEFELQQRFTEELNGNNVATPYLLIDTIPNIRIMITEWSDTNTMLGRQFLSGDILDNPDVLPKLAQTIASVNLSSFDSSLNADWVESFQPIAKSFDGMLLGVLDRKNEDAAIAYAKNALGKERLEQMNQAYHKVMARSESLIHGDFHVNNVLIDDSGKDNKSDNFLVVDWEMARPGPLGYDVGIFLAYPIELAMFLAARGKLQDAKRMMEQLYVFWKIYAFTLVQEGDFDEESLQQVLKMVIAGCGWGMTIPMYCMGLCREDINKDGLSEEEIQRVYGIYGKAGLKCFEFGYMDDILDVERMTLKDMEDFLFSTVTMKELDRLAMMNVGQTQSFKPRSRFARRRSSGMLRDVLPFRRLSSCSLEEQKERRRSSASSFVGVLHDIEF